MARSQNGWPALLPASRSLVSWNLVGDTSTRLRMRQGSAGFLLAHLAGRFDRKVQDVDGPLLDDWAYAYRAVRGYSLLSNHASGTAIDLNATRHPLGVRGTFDRDQVVMIERLLKRYDGCIRWGGHYTGRADAMHFEINLPLPTCERVARRLADTGYGRRLLERNPGQRAVIFS